ncbi:hypothetical protein SVIOM74S_00083 [Streptomyces violarus]
MQVPRSQQKSAFQRPPATSSPRLPAPGLWPASPLCPSSRVRGSSSSSCRTAAFRARLRRGRSEPADPLHPTPGQANDPDRVHTSLGRKDALPACSIKTARSAEQFPFQGRSGCFPGILCVQESTQTAHGRQPVQLRRRSRDASSPSAAQAAAQTYQRDSSQAGEKLRRGRQAVVSHSGERPEPHAALTPKRLLDQHPPPAQGSHDPVDIGRTASAHAVGADPPAPCIVPAGR